MSSLRAITVYCSSSSSLAPEYYKAATRLGRLIADAGWTLVYGGNFIGLMGSVAQGARDASGKVIGITPQLFIDKGVADDKCDELVVTANMRERKAILEQRGDGFIALPGGLGTFEEIFEIIVGRQLGYHQKPIVLLNTADYYRPLLAMIEHGIEQNFIRVAGPDLFYVAKTPEEAVAHLRSHSPPLTRTNIEPSAQE